MQFAVFGRHAVYQPCLFYYLFPYRCLVYIQLDLLMLHILFSSTLPAECIYHGITNQSFTQTCCFTFISSEQPVDVNSKRDKDDYKMLILSNQLKVQKKSNDFKRQLAFFTI